MSKNPGVAYVATLVVRACLLALVLTCLLALAACQTNQTTQNNTPSNGGPAVEAANDTSVLAGFPLFTGMSELPDRVEFEWKNLDTAYKIPDSYWAYYLVPAPFLEVAAFYRTWAIEPPFDNTEIYWKETPGGVLSAYFQKEADTVYSRIWFMPHPSNSQESYLIIMRNNDIGGCSIF